MTPFDGFDLTFFNTVKLFLQDRQIPSFVISKCPPVVFSSKPNRFFARHFDAEKSRPEPQTIKINRSRGNFETRPELLMMKSTFGKQYHCALSKTLKLGWWARTESQR